MRKSNLERLREAKRKEFKPVYADLEGLFKILLGGKFNPTQQAFIYSPDRIKGYKGPAGCAKTSTICAMGLARALLQPGSKGLVARHDYNNLVDTTAARMTEMLNRLPKGTLVDRDKSPPMKWYIQSAHDSGEISQITFMGLKEALGSYEFNWAIVDEADEVEEMRIHEISTRLRNQGGDYTIGLAFNPPDKHHWLYTACTGKDFQDKRIKDPWIKLFEPQSRENVRNLPKNYYENMAETLPEDMRQRLVDGEWGSTFQGMPVYREFKYNIHVKDSLEYSPEATLIRCWDFGYQRPACIWTQVDWLGRWNILREELGNQEEATAFARRCKAITAQHFPQCRNIVDYGDPAVAQHKDTGKTLAMFAREGITILFTTTQIDFGVKLMRQQLSRIIEGEPAIMFDRRHCPILISAFRGGYRFDKHGQKPFKDGYYDHLADALRYGAVNIFGGGAAAINNYDKLPASLEYNSAYDNFGSTT